MRERPATCRSCRHFDDDPRSLEARLPGLTILGSAYSSTRADAGICEVLQRFQSPVAAAACPGFEPREPGGLSLGKSRAPDIS